MAIEWKESPEMTSAKEWEIYVNVTFRPYQMWNIHTHTRKLDTNPNPSNHCEQQQQQKEFFPNTFSLFDQLNTITHRTKYKAKKKKKKKFEYERQRWEKKQKLKPFNLSREIVFIFVFYILNLCKLMLVHRLWVIVRYGCDFDGCFILVICE